ncbi:lactate racemase domain-containing protein [Actinoplanes solisilvae]|uniref:lactate racemase domain-containing protein n=1 Tax=Actinoplanes solisilvae TaxID=2486853 RepID=UPI000FD914FE|nr:lactate racemase domain-containing protein [Actinoplanes solisilvae]
MTSAVTGRAARVGGAERVLSEAEVREFVIEQLAHLDVDGRSVCVLVPDATRTCPLPLLVGAVHQALHGRVSRLTVLIALGTHGAMTPEALEAHVGVYPDTTVINHAWWEPSTFAHLGTIPSERIAELSSGRMSGDVPVLLNRAVVDHDIALVVGPVLPHEVVGMSGGNKYFFPGVAGQQIIDVSHWLGALITSSEIIGTTGLTPVRALINDGAALIPAETYAFCVVTAESPTEPAPLPVHGPIPGDPAGPGAHSSISPRIPVDSDKSSALHSISFGDCISSWASAAEISAATHVTYLDRPVRRVLSLVPTMYDEIWTGAKGFYKVEPVVADGGEVILYAPHITEIAASHPQIYEIGYHCRDYFVKQWDSFKNVHWGVLAHSTHLRGAGTFEQGVEKLRVDVTLATGIPEEVCRSVNLGYRDPATIDVASFAADPDTLVVPRAGEVLFRLR